MSIKDFKVGDKVYIRDYGFRDNEDTAEMKEAVVTKVGTKVVTVQGQFASTHKFKFPENGETLYLEECVNGTKNKLFRTMDDFEDWKEKTEAVKYLYRYFTDSWNMNTMSIDKIRKIMDIIKGAKGGITMTVKDLKELVSKIPEEYDDLLIVTDDPKYDEYCMGNSFELVDGFDGYKTIYSNFTKLGDMDVYYFRLYR